MVALALVLLAARARAETGATVVLAHAPGAPPTVMEALVHLRGELAAAGFETQLLELPIEADDIRASLERAAPGVDAVAVVAVLAVAAPSGAPDPGAAELWVVDRVTRKTVVRRARVEAGTARAAQILSVRAAELLRASFVELAITQQPAAPAPEQPKPPTGTATAARWVSAAIDEQRRPWTYGIEVGGSVLGGAGGVGPALLPILRLEAAIGQSGLVRLSAAGLGAPVRVETPAAGYADVTQDLVLAEGMLRFRPGRRLQPLASLGVGALRLHADGHVGAPYVGVSGTRWAGALDAGAGVRLSLRRRIDVALEVHVVAAEPYPVIQFQGAEVARAARPSALASVTVVGGL
jgi:hypothetical protein